MHSMIPETLPRPSTAIAHTAEVPSSHTVRGLVELSVVIPAYGAADCLRPLHERLTRAIHSLGITYELVFVEDCSPDDSWSVLRSLADSDTNVRAFKLSRNFGQQMAITAGLSKSRGNWIVVMDCDLQDPPELIPQLYEKARSGFDIVLAKRCLRKHGWLRIAFNRMYYGTLNFFAQTSINGNYGSFSVISRPVRDAFLRFSDRNRHYLMILFWLGFKTCGVDYDQSERYAGKSSYTLASLVKHSIAGVFFQTTTLLKMIVGLGFCVSVAGAALAVWSIVSYIAHAAIPGWTSLCVLTLLLGGAILTCQGIVGLYVG